MRQHSRIRFNADVLITRTFALITVLACVDVTFVCGLQSSVLADLKQVEQASASRIPNKVKRAQEVVMFGNQQNKLSEHNYLRTDKRDIPNIPVPDVQNNLDKDEIEEPVAMASIDPLPPYTQLSALRNRYYYDEPDAYESPLYEDRQKRNAFKRLPMKRSDRIFRSLSDDNSRAKRESQLSQLDPEELLSLLATWEEDQQHRKRPSSWRNNVRNLHSEYDPYSNEYASAADLDNDDSQENEEWLDAPIPVHHFNVKPRFYPPYPSRQTRKYKNIPDEYPRPLMKFADDSGRYEHGLPEKRYLL